MNCFVKCCCAEDLLRIKDTNPTKCPEMPSNPANMRSTVFALKCKMGTPLTRLDFNLVLHSSNAVKQLYYSVEDNVHLVCLRLSCAITRTRFVNALIKIERKPLTNFKRPDEGTDWSAFVFIGNQLLEGTGFEIRQTLKRHMETRNPAFFQSHSTNTRHITHMLRNTLRTNRNIPEPAAPFPEPVLDRSGDSARTVPIQPEVFSPPLVMANGQLNMAEVSMHIREMAASAIRDLLQDRPEVNLQTATASLCVVCQDAPVAAALRPCFHAGYCMWCAEEVLARSLPCPMCRATVEGVQRVFLP